MSSFIKDLSDFGAVGDGATDDTVAIQSAFDAAPCLFIPPQTYRITQPIVQRKSMRLFGAGQSSLIKADFSATQIGALVVNLTTTSNPSDTPTNGSYEGFAIAAPCPNIYIDLSVAPNQFLNRWLWKNVKLDNTAGGYSFVLNNPSHTAGFFCSTIEDCFFHGGLSLSRSGDSLNIERNTIYGPGNGIDVSMVPGASHLYIGKNNITSDGYSIHCGANVRNVTIEYNQIEHLASSQYMLVLWDAAGLTRPIIRGNNLNGHNAVVTAIAMGYCAGGIVDENLIFGCTNGAYIPNIGNSAIHIGKRNVNACANPWGGATAPSVVYE